MKTIVIEVTEREYKEFKKMKKFYGITWKGLLLKEFAEYRSYNHLK